MTFRIGQRVICVDNSYDTKFLPSVIPPSLFHKDVCGLKQDGIYTVRGHVDYFGVPTITLKEIERPMHNPNNSPGYHVARFRPVTDISVFTAMLKTKKIDA